MSPGIKFLPRIMVAVFSLALLAACSGSPGTTAGKSGSGSAAEAPGQARSGTSGGQSDQHSKSRNPDSGSGSEAPNDEPAAPTKPGAPSDGGQGRQEYDDPNHNPDAEENYIKPVQGSTSTFAVDIDTASYDYARRTLQDGNLPDPLRIRAEEFVNAFRQDYPNPGGNGILVHTDGSRLPGSYSTRGDARLMRVGLQTKPESLGKRADANLTFVIDVSGSMGEPGRLDLVKDSLHTLIDQLRPSDSVAIVTFSSEAEVVSEMTSVHEKADLHRAVDSLYTKESTNLEAGLVTGYKVATSGYKEGVANRVILLSDGLANTGATSFEPILSQVKEFADKKIALLCVGVGREYGDDLMEQLADKGDGFAVYVSEQSQARKLFVDRLPSTLSVRAQDAKVQVDFNLDNVESYRLIGFDNRALAAEDFRNDAVDGGELGPGHSVTALYLVRLKNSPERAWGPSDVVATATTRWQDPESGEAAEGRSTVYSRDLTAEMPSERLRVDYIAAAFAEYLQGNERVSLRGLADEAEQLAVKLEDKDVDELAALIRKARTLDWHR